MGVKKEEKSCLVFDRFLALDLYVILLPDQVRIMASLILWIQ